MIKTAIIGCGRIAWKLEEDPLREKPCTHLGAISLFKNFRLMAACDQIPNKVHDLGQKYNLDPDRLFTDQKKFFDFISRSPNNHPDLLIIATPTESHFSILKMAITINIPVIVSEKPVTLNIADALKIKRHLAKSKSRVLINHERRYHEKYIRLFGLVEREQLGKLAAIKGTLTSNSSRIPQGKKQQQEYKNKISKYGSILLHDGTHLIDLVIRLTGRIESVQASGEFHKQGPEKWLACQLISRKGVFIQLDFSGTRDYFHFEIDVWGEKGRIIMGNGIEKYHVSQPSPFYTGFQSLVEKMDLHYKSQMSPFYNLYLEITQYFKKQKPLNFHFQSTLLDSIESMKVIDAIYKSAKNKGKKVLLR